MRRLGGPLRIKTLAWTRHPQAEHAESFVWNGQSQRRPLPIARYVVLAACVASGFLLGRLSLSIGTMQSISSTPQVISADADGRAAPLADAKSRAAAPVQPPVPPITLLNPGSVEKEPARVRGTDIEPEQRLDANPPAESRARPLKAPDRNKYRSSSPTRWAEPPGRGRESQHHPSRDYGDLRAYMLRP